MRVVIDTNVVVSAILRDRDPEKVVLFVLESEAIQWVGSSGIVDEYLEVLSRPKFRIPQEELDAWRDRFNRSITRFETTELIVEFPRDRKDAKFLACAIAAAADFLITGDQDFGIAQSLIQTKIVSVRQFKELIVDTVR